MSDKKEAANKRNLKIHFSDDFFSNSEGKWICYWPSYSYIFKKELFGVSKTDETEERKGVYNQLKWVKMNGFRNRLQPKLDFFFNSFSLQMINQVQEYKDSAVRHC